LDKSPENPEPLRGLRVLEFSHTVMGPCAGLLLADLGATVIKVEPSPDGDRTRKLTGFAGGFFATFNRNKQSLAVDLKTAEGQAVVHRLIDSIDIVIENYGPGTMEKLGCGCDQLRARNPRLVYLALKGYLGGPWQNRPALDEVVQFQSGLAYMTGPAGQPLRAGASIIDILGAVFGVTGVLAALRERDQTGLGQRVGSSLFESAAFLMAPHMVGGKTTGLEVPPMTERKGAWGVYDVFHSDDNEALFIGVTSDPQWQRFCATFQFDDLGNDQALASNQQRNDARVTLIPELETRFRQLSIKQMIDGCTVADVSWSPVGRPEDLFDNEQLNEGDGMLQLALDSALDSINSSTAIPGLPLEFGSHRRRSALTLQPPKPGEHTLACLVDCGFGEEEIKHLLDRAILYQQTDQS